MLFTRVDRFVVIPLVVGIMSMTVLAFWLPHSNVAVHPAIFRIFAIIEIVLLVFYAFSRFAVSRAAGDSSRPGRAFRATFSATALLSLFLVIGLPGWYSGGILSFLGTAAGGPLVDANLAAADQALGFDWLGFLSLTNRTAFVPAILQFAYHSAIWQLPAVAIILIVTSQSKRLLEFGALISVTSAITVGTCAFVPAIGPFAYFQPAPDIYDSYSSIVGSWHREAFDALRSGQPFLITRSAGLVSFPSFHTILGIVLAFALRETPYVRGPAIILNALLIVGTLSVGCHYLVDVLAGAAIATLSIYMVCFFRIASVERRASSSAEMLRPAP